MRLTTYSRVVAILCVALSVTPYASAQDWRELVGYNKLKSEVGASLENGAGIAVSLVEAGGKDKTFMPDTSIAEFTGKTILNGTGSGGAISGHATGVGQIMFGNNSSIAAGVTQITAYDADDWVYTRAGVGTANNPLPNPFSVQNHSYIGTGDPVAKANETLARFDYMINRDGVTSVVAMNNGGANPLPQLMGQSYNSISVGLTNGQHSHGLTDLGTTGRIKPDIVAPAGATSSSTPMVSSAAILLHQKAVNMNTPDARTTETMKAIIMAGATKSEFPSWDQGTNGSGVITRPLDDTFGAGELNVYNSYRILEGGEFDGATGGSQGGLIALKGWDYGETIAVNNTKHWTFEIGPGQTLSEASILLTWNAQYADINNNFSNTLSLANMRLQLWDSTSSFMGNLLYTSDSPVDNVEHLYLQNLASGKYTFGVTSDLSTDFGIAWNITAVPEPSSLAILGLAASVGSIWLGRKRFSKKLKPI
ncbi:MAG: PEP-CTERM sorting domain-containing protein [Pirellulales bacterium]